MFKWESLHNYNKPPQEMGNLRSEGKKISLSQHEIQSKLLASFYYYFRCLWIFLTKLG